MRDAAFQLRAPTREAGLPFVIRLDQAPVLLCRTAMVVAATVHILVAHSILRQPLDPNVPPTLARSPVWRYHFDSAAWPGPGVDFFALYHAGVQSRRGASPFALGEDPPRTPFYFRYLYSPLLAGTLGAALAGLSPETAYRLWAGIIETVLLATIWIWRRATPGPRLRDCGTAVLLISTPFFLELHTGQFTFASTALSLIGVLLAGSHGVWRLPASLLVAAGVLLKSFPLVGVAALLHRKYLAVVVTALVAAAASIASSFTSAGEAFSGVWVRRRE